MTPPTSSSTKVSATAAAVLDRLDRLHQQLDALIRNQSALNPGITNRRDAR